jgi:hypothetical protein
LWRIYRRGSIDWRLLLLGFFIPGILALSSQWIVAYWMARGEQVRVLIRPLEVESAFSGFLVPKLFLSILFPLATLLLWFGQMSRDRAVQLSWLALIFGAAQMYLLAEGGDRFYHGNFRWGAQIALFLLFAATARVVARMSTADMPNHRYRLAAAYGAYLLHALAGVAYFVRTFVSKSYG